MAQKYKIITICKTQNKKSGNADDYVSTFFVCYQLKTTA